MVIPPVLFVQSCSQSNKHTGRGENITSSAEVTIDHHNLSEHSRNVLIIYVYVLLQYILSIIYYYKELQATGNKPELFPPNTHHWHVVCHMLFFCCSLRPSFYFVNLSDSAPTNQVTFILQPLKDDYTQTLSRCLVWPSEWFIMKCTQRLTPLCILYQNHPLHNNNTVHCTRYNAPDANLQPTAGKPDPINHWPTWQRPFPAACTRMMCVCVCVCVCVGVCVGVCVMQSCLWMLRQLLLDHILLNKLLRLLWWGGALIHFLIFTVHSPWSSWAGGLRHTAHKDVVLLPVWAPGFKPVQNQYSFIPFFSDNNKSHRCIDTNAIHHTNYQYTQGKKHLSKIPEVT